VRKQGCFVAERPWRTVHERYRADADVWLLYRGTAALASGVFMFYVVERSTAAGATAG
jgi:hypothetical protein